MRDELQKSLSTEEDLSKFMGAGMSGDVNMASSGSMDFGKAEEKKKLKGRQHELDHDKDGDIEADDLAALREKKKMKKAEHPDEKEDKKLIAQALDRHNEKKHGEAKNKDSAKKDMGLKKKDDDEGEESQHWAAIRDGIVSRRVKDPGAVRFGRETYAGETNHPYDDESPVKITPKNSVPDAPPKKLYKSEEQLTTGSNGQWILTSSNDRQ